MNDAGCLCCTGPVMISQSLESSCQQSVHCQTLGSIHATYFMMCSILARFRFGKESMKPVTVKQTQLAKYICLCTCLFVFIVIIIARLCTKQSGLCFRTALILAGSPSVYVTLPSLLPVAWVFHAMWKNLSHKRQAQSSLAFPWTILGKPPLHGTRTVCPNRFSNSLWNSRAWAKCTSLVGPGTNGIILGPTKSIIAKHPQQHSKGTTLEGPGSARPQKECNVTPGCRDPTTRLHACSPEVWFACHVCAGWALAEGPNHRESLILQAHEPRDPEGPPAQQSRGQSPVTPSAHLTRALRPRTWKAPNSPGGFAKIT